MKVQYIIVTIITILVVSVSVGAVAVSASVNSKPGDTLFEVDKSIENLQRNNIVDTFQGSQFENEIMRERLTELIDMHQSQDKNLNLGIREVSDQYDRLNKSMQSCTKCTYELKQANENLIKSTHEFIKQIRNQAKKDKNSDLEASALALENRIQNQILAFTNGLKPQVPEVPNTNQQAEVQPQVVIVPAIQEPAPIQQPQVQQVVTQPQPAQSYEKEDHYEGYEQEENDD